MVFFAEDGYHMAWMRMSIVSSGSVLLVRWSHGSAVGFRLDDWVQKWYQGLAGLGSSITADQDVSYGRVSYVVDATP